ncbi:MAG: hypothetical protein FJ398_22000 [Verrucomicrobia bacterium]|nr:hypothetical protein [Verrucomicrobiota bacterium]
MNHRMLLILPLCWASTSAALELPRYDDFAQPPHNYWQRTPTDCFTKLKADLESRRIVLDSTSEKAFVASLLKALDIPASSQLLVFSTTSLQLSLISTSRPRALYFSEDLYLGYVQGGRIEIVSLDPELGGIFYIFDLPRDEQPLRIERSNRCMNCHAASETRSVPGLLVKSVVSGPNRGSLDSFRTDEIGHSVPFSERFGGWYVTGAHAITNHWGNLTGRLSPEGLTKIPVEPGRHFDWDRYPAATSDILPHLLHEHQAGFVNRAVEAAYRGRAYLHAGEGRLNKEQAEELDRQARQLSRYLLFADEAPLPEGGVQGDPAFKQDFQRNRKTADDGSSLKDFDLRTRLFKHRCSYMIYSAAFQGLPSVIKERVYRRLGEATDVAKPDPEYAYLSPGEKNALRRILKETLSDLPAWW